MELWPGFHFLLPFFYVMDVANLSMKYERKVFFYAQNEMNVKSYVHINAHLIVCEFIHTHRDTHI